MPALCAARVPRSAGRDFAGCDRLRAPVRGRTDHAGRSAWPPRASRNRRPGRDRRHAGCCLGDRPSWRRGRDRGAARCRRIDAGAARRLGAAAAGGDGRGAAPPRVRDGRAACGGTARAAPPAFRCGGAAPARSGIRAGVRADHAGVSGRGDREPAWLRRAAADGRGVRRSDRAAGAHRLRRAGTNRPGRAAARPGVRARGQHDPGSAGGHRPAQPCRAAPRHGC